MAKKKSPNDLYWEAMAHTQIKNEYVQFLQQDGLERNPDSAQMFAIRKRRDGYRGMSERDLILLVLGDLPDMYD
jgi:hypothetical protein